VNKGVSAAGPVTEADILRLYPWSNATMTGQLGTDELRKVVCKPWPGRWMAWGFDAVSRAVEELAVLAVLAGDAADQLGLRILFSLGGSLRPVVAHAEEFHHPGHVFRLSNVVAYNTRKSSPVRLRPSIRD
jgi:hypothetical protein